MPEKKKAKKATRQMKVRDMKPEKDAKAGGLQFQAHGPAPLSTHHRET